MGDGATASTRGRDSTAQKRAAKRGAKSAPKEKKEGKAPAKKGGSKRATSASVSKNNASVLKKIDALSKQVDALDKSLKRELAKVLKALERKDVHDVVATKNGTKHSRVPVDAARFDDDLVKILADLDRRGRHDGLVPIPEVREAFLVRGWTRAIFDDRLLQAERDFIVDLKTADDPKHLAEPDLAIRDRGRGHLQYVVVR